MVVGCVEVLKCFAYEVFVEHQRMIEFEGLDPVGRQGRARGAQSVG